MIERIQHRGLSSDRNKGLPNSFESFRKRYGQAIELDVFLLRDGSLAVLHNKDLGLSQESVEAMSLEELEKLSVPDKEGGEVGRIPLFEEFVFNCLDRGNGLVVEIKASSSEVAEKLSRILVERIARMFTEDRTFSQHPEFLKQLGLHSFSIEALEAAEGAMKEVNLELPRGLFWPSTPTNSQEMNISATAIERSGFQEGDNWVGKGIDMAEKLGVESINLHWSVINEDVVTRAHDKGLRVFAWVVNAEQKAKELEQMGVDKIITEN